MANMFRMYLRGAGGLNEFDWDDTPIIPSYLGVDDGPQHTTVTTRRMSALKNGLVQPHGFCKGNKNWVWHQTHENQRSSSKF